MSVVICHQIAPWIAGIFYVSLSVPGEVLGRSFWWRTVCSVLIEVLLLHRELLAWLPTSIGWLEYCK